MQTLLILLLVSLSVFASTRPVVYYASPDGDGDGSFERPWNLQTALTKVAVLRGNRLQLRGGTYKGKFTSYLTYTVVENYENERVIIDGNYITSLGSSINSTMRELTIKGTFSFAPADTVQVDVEVVQISERLSNGNYIVNRGWDGTTAVSHTVNAPVRAKGNTLTVWGSDTTYRDLEVQDSYPVRVYPNTRGYAGGARGGEGFFVFGERLKFINNVIHDNADGFFISESASDVELYGNIIFNNGHVAVDRPHGMGLYIQNRCPSRATVSNNIVFNNFGGGAKLYGANEGHAECSTFDGHVGFNNGSPSYYDGSPSTSQSSMNWRLWNLLIGADVHPSRNIAVRNSSLYHPPGNVVELGGLSLGRARTGGNRNITVTNNYVAEPWGTLLQIDRWSEVTVVGNTIAFNGAPVSNRSNPLLVSVTTPTTVNAFDRNDYYSSVPLGNCFGGSLRADFVHTGFMANPCGAFLQWAEWKQKTGFDANGTHTVGVPTTNVVKTYPNQYEVGRGTIVVYNWENSPTVKVSIGFAGLKDGQAFEIRNVQNWFGPPVSSGTFKTGMTVDISTRDTKVTTPIGHTFTPVSTCPKFCVYVVMPVNSTVTPSPTLTPSRSLTPSPTPSFTRSSLDD